MTIPKRCGLLHVRLGIGLLVTFFTAVLSHAATAEETGKDGKHYIQQIKPLLRERCYSCHGALKQKGSLRLDTVTAMLRGGDSGAAIVPGQAGTSRLVQRVAASSPSERMPPEHEGEPLTAEQIQVIKAWLAAGAPSPENEAEELDPLDHWAFRPIRRRSQPWIKNSNGRGNEIDDFLTRQHEELGLIPQPSAPRSVLLRRLALDLVGIPPSPEELLAFVNDGSPDWYERAVDRLLDDPRHGERWGRHWMDIWRYSDWWGLGQQLRNSQKHIWHWRDWIIDSINADLPYDEMIRLMLAADELYPDDMDKLRASGFLARNYFLFNRNQWMDEVVEHVSKGFLGLTINCAKCHEHKFDPITQHDFYAMRAVFEPYHVRVDVLPGESDLNENGIPRAFDGLLDTPTYLFVRGQENAPDTGARIEPNVPVSLSFSPFTVRSVTLPKTAWQPERRPWVLDDHLSTARTKLASAQSKVDSLKKKLESKGVDPSEPSLGTVESANEPRSAKLAVAELAVAELAVAELAVAWSQAELNSIELRIAAWREEWSHESRDGGNSNEGTTTLASQLRRDAVRASRNALVAKAKHDLADAERRLNQAASDKKQPIEKEVEKARGTLAKALNELETPIRDAPPPSFDGAAWTPTRFFNSTKDDPLVTFPATSSGRRTALAEWITSERNPLTARVAVNHIWLRHMGAPLVATVFDLGRKNAAPNHPELLDWLATELRDNDWSIKHIHRLIVTSNAYRMGTSATEDNMAKDPDNLRWWRRTPIRLESQVVRDSILSLAGTLDSTRGGPAVPATQQATSQRRSLYFFHSNNERNLFLSMFDEALVNECYRREQSIVPQQAMALTNSQLVLDASQEIAARIDRQVRSFGDASRVSDSSLNYSDELFIRQAFAAVLCSSPNDAEMAACSQALSEWRKNPKATPTSAHVNLIWVLLNHNDFVTMR